MFTVRQGFAGVLAVASLLPLHASNQDPRTTDWAVGASTHRFVPAGGYPWRGARTEALIVDVWYPVRKGTPMSFHTIGPPDAPLFRLGMWADNAALATGRFPLIVLSHGTGGSSRIMAWLASALAARGYIVGAVNHPGNNALEAYTAEGFLLWWERARDLTATIDMLLADQGFALAIDRDRIGVAGFSLGGYTAVVIAGGRTDPKRFRSFCRSAMAEGCADPPEFPGLFDRWAELDVDQPFQKATSAAARSLRDSRVRSVLALAPALGQAFLPESLGGIGIPVAIVAGSDDRLVPVRSNAQLLASLIPTAALTLLPDVDHYTFLATCTESGRAAQPQLCSDAAGVSREAVHQRVVQFASIFFADTLP